jgi:hypothetical protein
MPDERCGEQPASNPERPPSIASQAIEPVPAPTQENIVRSGCRCNASEKPNGSDDLSKKVHWTQHAMLVTQVALGLIGIAALIIYAGQWREMKKATRATQDSVTNADRNFRRDERAWIGFSFVPGNIPFTLGKPFLVPTLLINSGKTPAKDVQGNIVVGVFESGKPLDFSYTAGHANYRIAAGTIFPNGSITESFQAIRHGSYKAEAIILDKPLMDDILNSRSLVLVHGKITYSDIFGIEHWTTYCRVVSNPSLIPDDCTRYNDTDSN